MPGFMPGIHVFCALTEKDVDGIGSRACPTSASNTCHKSGKPDLPSPAMTIDSYEYLARKMAAYNIPSTRGSQSDSSGM
jgi:hypothetical protein